MRFYYRIYQKTKVLTRKRKKKSTKANNKSHPSKKRKTDSSTEQTDKMEVDDVNGKAPKIASKINGDGAKDKINGVKESKKVSPVTKPASKLSLGGKTSSSSVDHVKPVKSGKSVTINQNVSYSSDRTMDKVPSKPKPLSPILKNVSSVDKSVKPPVSKTKSPVTEVKSKSTTAAVSSNVNQNSIKSSHSLSSKKSSPSSGSLTSAGNKTNTSKPGVNNTSSTVNSDKKSVSESSIVKDSCKEKVTQLPVTASSKVGAAGAKCVSAGVKISENIKSASTEKLSTKIIPTSEVKKSNSENQVVEISVEVSASDIKKVLEKKKAEKESKLVTNGEEKLFSNYSIVDQLKKSNAAAANLANQKKQQQQQQASMMDFTRSSEALSGPKVPPNVQGLQPKQNSGNDLSQIVQSLVQKQALRDKKIQAATNTDNKSSEHKSKELSSPASGSEARSSEADKLKQSSETGTKTLGTMLGNGLSTKSVGEKSVTSMAPKLPTSTSIKPINKESHVNSTSAADSSAVKGQQSKNGLPTTKANTSQESVKNTESLTKNIPAGTTVTVKTVENKQTKVPSPVSSTPSTKNSAFRMNLSNSSFSLGKGVTNPFTTSSDLTQAQLMNNPLLQTHMTMALAQQQAQYLSLQNPLAAAALTSQLEAAAAAANANYINNINNSLVRAAAANITQSPMTTLAFTKPVSSEQDTNRFGLKIPQPPPATRHSSPSVSNFGTSRLQVKVNSDSPKPADISSKSLPVSKSVNGDTKTSSPSSAPKLPAAIHSMPAMIPFQDMKKVQAIPKTFSNTNRSLPISSILSKSNSGVKTGNSPPKSPSVTTPSSLTTESKTSSPSPVKSISSSDSKPAISPSSNAPFKPVTQTKSLTKLVADLNSAVKQKKAENLLNTLKKTNENSLFNGEKKFGLEKNLNEKQKEVTSS